MTRPMFGTIVVALVVPLGAAALAGQAGRGAPAGQTTEAALGQAIDKLGDFDLPARTQASRTVRRAPADLAVPALSKAARSHTDSYVRYRACVLLTDFGESAATPVMRDLIEDRDNRVRLVALGWFGVHPDPAVLPKLLAALDTERSEFVRPALTRAVAAYGDDPRARAALEPLVTRGADLFRSAVIEALGDSHARYASAAIADVAKLDGPLQDEAVLSLGKIGDASVLAQLSALQQHGPDEVQPAVAAAVCMITHSCAVQDEFLKKTLAFAAAHEDRPSLLSRVAHALDSLAATNHAPAFATLFDAGVAAKDPTRSVIAVSIGTVALRNPLAILTALEARSDLSAATALLRDGFDLLSEEDFGQERFYLAIRQAAAAAPAGSKPRQVGTAVLDALEF
jgi:HEAT repeat protein